MTIAPETLKEIIEKATSKALTGTTSELVDTVLEKLSKDLPYIFKYGMRDISAQWHYGDLIRNAVETQTLFLFNVPQGYEAYVYDILITASGESLIRISIDNESFYISVPNAGTISLLQIGSPVNLGFPAYSKVSATLIKTHSEENYYNVSMLIALRKSEVQVEHIKLLARVNLNEIIDDLGGVEWIALSDEYLAIAYQISYGMRSRIAIFRLSDLYKVANIDLQTESPYTDTRVERMLFTDDGRLIVSAHKIINNVWTLVLDVYSPPNYDLSHSLVGGYFYYISSDGSRYLYTFGYESGRLMAQIYDLNKLDVLYTKDYTDEKVFLDGRIDREIGYATDYWLYTPSSMFILFRIENIEERYRVYAEHDYSAFYIGDIYDDKVIIPYIINMHDITQMRSEIRVYDVHEPRLLRRIELQDVVPVVRVQDGRLVTVGVSLADPNTYLFNINISLYSYPDFNLIERKTIESVYPYGNFTSHGSTITERRSKYVPVIYVRQIEGDYRLYLDLYEI